MRKFSGENEVRQILNSYLVKETSTDRSCFETWQTFAWNYWRQNER